MKPTTAQDWNRADRDLLISLNTKFEIFVKTYAEDMKDLKDGVSTKIADHEIRISAIEKIVEQTRPVETVRDFLVLKQNYHDDKTRIGAWRWMIGFIGGVVVWGLMQIPNILRNWGLIR